MRVIVYPELPFSYLCDRLYSRYEICAIFSDQKVGAVEDVIVDMVDYALSPVIPICASVGCIFLIGINIC